MTVTVEIREPEKATISEAQVEIYVDAEGVEYLIAQLDDLRTGRDTHIHLRSESWAGYELAEAAFGENTKIVHQVLIQLVPKGVTLGSK